MTVAIGLVFAVLGIAFVLFATGWIRPDVTAMLALLALVVTGTIAPEEAFEGFSSFAVMTIAGLLVIGEGLEKTGVVRWVARRLERVVGQSEGRLLLVNTTVPGMLSGFVNIIAAVSFFIPVILRLCHQLKINPAKILLPMSTAALVGANLTLIGAGHNLVVHSLLEDAEGRGFGFFEFTVVGVALLVATLVYTSLLGVRLLAKERRGSPEREAAESADLIEVYDLKERLSEVWVTRRCAKKALTVEDLGLRERFGLTLLELVREEEILKTEKRTRTLREGDTLLLAGRREQVEELCAAFPGLEGMGTPRAKEKYPVSSAELAEGVVPARSPVIGKSAKDLGFRERYGLCAIAYYRNGRPYRTFAQTEPYKEGDAILFYGPRDQMRDFDPEKDLLVYFKPGGPEVSARMRKRAPLAAAILALVVLVAAFDLVPIAVSALGGAVAMILTGIMNSFKSYRAIDWRTIVLIGGMYPLGLALEQTGAAELVGSGLVGLLGTLGPLAVMGGVVVLTIVLTQPIHNAAVAIIMTPIAINAAAQMGSSPRAFCVGVLVGCSLSFLMPFGHPAPLLVQEPGGYSKGDYIRYGLPLVLIALAVILLVVPLLWPL